VFNYKYSLFAEISPICKDDLVALEPKLASMLGGVSQLMLCTRITAGIHLLDPVSLKIVEVSAGTYFHHRFRSQISAKQLVEFIVIDIEKMDSARKEEEAGVTDMRAFNKQKLALNSKMCLAVCTVARSSDMGKNDVTFEVHTHLGHMLQAGDSVLGYDLTKANFNDEIQMSKKFGQRPQVILVRKSYPKRNRAGRRAFALKQLPKEESDVPLKKIDQQRAEADMEEFMNDIEEDPELQGKVNLYKRPNTVVQSARQQPAASAAAADSMGDAGAGAAGEDEEEEEEEDDAEFPQIDMNALLEDMGAITIGAFDEHAGKEVDTDNEEVEQEAPPRAPGAAAAAGAAGSAGKGKLKGRK
jgi:nonsense-mediated mRNA decay protein 3